MKNSLFPVFRQFEQERIPYCLLRDADRLDQLMSRDDLEGLDVRDRGAVEIDLLVRDSDFARCSALLMRLGFVRLPDYGYAPHHFFVAYDRETDRWLKVDVITRVAFGVPVAVFSTDLADELLGDRRREGNVYVPAPEAELMVLLLHCVLDKGRFSPERRRRISALRRLVTNEQHMTDLLGRYWLPATTWPTLANLIEREAWETLLKAQPAVKAHLAGGGRLGLVARQFTRQAQRKLNRWLTARSPRSFTVALLAPDGAGKSTLIGTLRESFYFPVRSIYMGLYQKAAPDSWLVSLPVIGFFARLCSLWSRYLKALYHLSRRRLVLFDRYTYDFHLPARRYASMASRWRRWLFAHACPAPDLVIVLDAPGDVLHARKGEHSAGLLEERRQQYRTLAQNLGYSVVDATRDANQVRRDVLTLIWDHYLRRQARVNHSSLRPTTSVLRRAIMSLLERPS